MLIKNDRKHTTTFTPTNEFDVGDPVSVKNQGTGPPWLPGKISEVVSPQRFIVQLADGRRIDRHVDHVKQRVLQPEDCNVCMDIQPDQYTLDDDPQSRMHQTTVRILV